MGAERTEGASWIRKRSRVAVDALIARKWRCVVRLCVG